MGTVLDKNSGKVRKRIENHTFEDEEGEEYGGSEFNGFNDYFRRKKIKLQNLDAQIRSASDKPQIFKGIVVHVTGYTQPPLHVLHREIVQHGGGFLQYLDSKTMATHIVASTLPPKKTVDFNRYRIVKSAWIMDSVAAGKLLPWTDFRVIDEGPRQKVLKFDQGKGLTQSTPQSKQGYREQTDNSFYTTQLKAATLPSQSLSQVAESVQASTEQPGHEGNSDLGLVNMVKTTESDDLPPDHGYSMDSDEEKDLDGEYANEGTKAGSPNETEYTKEIHKSLGFSEDMTPEEHNAWLLSDPRLRKSSTANPDFIRQYYSESRLHHLSTWKSELKSKMQKLAVEKGLADKRLKRRPGSRRYIMHVDFDSFFCAVSLKKHPDLTNKPVVIAHSTGLGSEIASCNYPARGYGVKNGMWMKRALDLCPDLKVLPYDFPAYEDASRKFYESIMELGGLVQSVSVDEALIDATSIVLAAAQSEGVGIDEGSIWREQEKVDDLAQALRQRIQARTGCAVSVGIGGNILQAKVALRRAKPAGQYQLKPVDVLDVIGELEVEDLPGVSHSIGGKLNEIGIKFVKDIREVSRERLVATLGPKTGEKLRDYSRGLDRVEVGEQPPRKSVSAEVNWGIRFITQEEAEEFVYNLCKELEKRLTNEQVKGRQLTMKIMRRALDAPLDPAKHLGHGKCDTFNKSFTFGVATHDYKALGKEAVSILRSFKFSPGDLRGLAVQMTKLEPLKFNSGGPDGSQKRLAFGSFVKPPSARKFVIPDHIEEPESPLDSKATGQHVSHDPITDDPLTPPKPRVHRALALSKAAEADAKSNTPINILGTQFIMPSNPDPSILAELPTDIRTKLMGQAAKTAIERASVQEFDRSRSGSPSVLGIVPSQVDADVFNALPEDMKAEVLATYGRKPTSLLQSPRKDRQGPSKKPVTPTKRGGLRGMFGRGQRQKDSQAGLVQTNFRDIRATSESAPEIEIEELDPDFLAELPEEVRREVLADYRRQRLAQRSGLDAPTRKQNGADLEGLLPGGQTKIHFPAPPPMVSFSGFDMTTTQEIKDMLDAWHAQTLDEGPHVRDVTVFENYLVEVVRVEKDMQKATQLVKWLDIVVNRGDLEGPGPEAWMRSLAGVKDKVQRAVKDRGLAPLKI
ncbi:DNA repair protein REV1 [Paramyrothecium foliicola]|nr:DNA repair protein REV1 [Paramyrothecium foliicola]